MTRQQILHMTIIKYKNKKNFGLFHYVFERSGNNNHEGNNGSYDPTRRFTMW